jgi:hypothetical protein
VPHTSSTVPATRQTDHQFSETDKQLISQYADPNQTSSLLLEPTNTMTERQKALAQKAQIDRRLAIRGFSERTGDTLYDFVSEYDFN